jgi:hypothetical protein
MKTLVRRLRQMNAMLESTGPERRGLRGLIRDYVQPGQSWQVDPDVKALSFPLIW